MNKKVLIIVMILSLITTIMPLQTFAEESSADVQALRIADELETRIGINDVNTDIVEKKSSYVAEGMDCNIIIPKESDGNIVISNDNNYITMKLPDDITNTDSCISENGTVIFDNQEAVSVAVQALTKEQDGIVVDSCRTMINIENNYAPKSYDFEFKLPSGCVLIKSEDYNGDDSDEGYIYIVNKRNKGINELTKVPTTTDNSFELIGVIEPAWAKDANGNAIETYYEIHGNKLVQYINFDENSVFPIIADPTTSKPANKKISDEYFNCTFDHVIVDLASFTLATADRFTPAAKTKIVRMLAKKLGSKIIPAISWASWAVLSYSVGASLAGYNYTKVYGNYEKWSYYKHQGGNWVMGYQYKNGNMKVKLLK